MVWKDQWPVALTVWTERPVTLMVRIEHWSVTLMVSVEQWPVTLTVWAERPVTLMARTEHGPVTLMMWTEHWPVTLTRIEHWPVTPMVWTEHWPVTLMVWIEHYWSVTLSHTQWLTRMKEQWGSGGAGVSGVGWGCQCNSNDTGRPISYPRIHQCKAVNATIVLCKVYHLPPPLLPSPTTTPSTSLCHHHLPPPPPNPPKPVPIPRRTPAPPFIPN